MVTGSTLPASTKTATLVTSLLGKILKVWYYLVGVEETIPWLVKEKEKALTQFWMVSSKFHKAGTLIIA